MPAAVKIGSFYLARYGIRTAKKFLESVKYDREEMDFYNHSKYFAGRISIHSNSNLYESFGRSNLIEAVYNEVSVNLTEPAVYLLEICSLLCPNRISVSNLVLAIATSTFSNGDNMKVVNEAVLALEGMGMILFDSTNRMIYISTCVQNAVIQTLVRENKFFDVVARVFDWLDSTYPSVPLRQFVPHLTSVFKKVDRLLNFEATSLPKDDEVVKRVRKYGTLFEQELAEDSISPEHIIDCLEKASVLTFETPSTSKIATQIENLLNNDRKTTEPTLTQTFTMLAN